MIIYFYPHQYLRDRQLDTIKSFPRSSVVNPELAEKKEGAQVTKYSANKKFFASSWKKKVPLLNLKLRPNDAPDQAVVYVWGGLIYEGEFILDLDNPWSLVGYNLKAMWLYKKIIKNILLNERCLQIKCMSNACRESLRFLFGQDVYEKATVCYPKMKQAITRVLKNDSEETRFLFVATQFEIKGGAELVKAFSCLYEKYPLCRLDLVTHLPLKYKNIVSSCPGIFVHEATLSRSEVHTKFMRKTDVLVLPTYVESFGMVALEALSHGLGVIATDVYALRELVFSGSNGELLQAPVSIWNEYLPSSLYYDLRNIKSNILKKDMSQFEIKLEEAMKKFVLDREWRLSAKQSSIQIMKERFV